MRQGQEVVKSWPALKSHQLYRVRIFNIEKLDEEREIQVTLEFLEKQMQGRHLDIRMSLPIRSDGVTADYFRACGIQVVPNMRITPRETIGKTLHVRFERTADDNYQVIYFEAICQEVTHDAAEY